MTVQQGQLDQRMRALGRANEIRFRRKEIKQQLAGLEPFESRQLCARLVTHPPAALASMAVGDLIVCCRGVWVAKSARMLRRARLYRSTPLSALTAQQRARLAGELRRRTPSELQRAAANPGAAGRAA